MSSKTLTGVDIEPYDYKIYSNSNLSLYCTNFCDVEAAFACHSISFIQSGRDIECTGDHSCANAGLLHSQDDIECDGSNSCSFTTINKTERLYCDADRACENTYISGAERVYAQGAYSLLNATIDSKDSPTLELMLYGYHSGFGATIICQANHVCEIECTVNGCHNLYANCIGNCSFVDADGTPMSTDMPIVSLRSVYNSRQITTANDLECNNEMALTFDDGVDDWRDSNETIIYADTTLCCRGSFGCRRGYDNSTITVESTLDMKYKLTCSGYKACYGAVIHNYMGAVLCSGQYSCAHSQINTTQALYCFGTRSCDDCYIYNTPFLICSAGRSCDESYIFSSSLGHAHYFYFLGAASGDNTQIYCHANDECLVICGGFEACFNTTIHCELGCRYTIECDADTECPVEHMITPRPTGMPITSSEPPTGYPNTLLPTMFPSQPKETYEASEATFNNDHTTHSDSIDVVFGAILIGCVALMPFIVMMCAYLFHRKRRGTDRPGYVSLLRFFGGIVDWYTDVLWAYALHIEGHSLWIPAFVCVFGSHFVSIMVCIFWITKWRQNRRQIHIAEYAIRYDKFVISLSVVSGFYGATALITSHLFHLGILSLCLDSAELSSISTMKILNESLLENIPVLAIQIVYLNSYHSDNTNFITLLAMFFTIISIVVMVLTLVERFINDMADRVHTATPGDDLNEIHLEFILESDEKRIIKRYHVHTQHLLSEAIRTVFEIERSQVKIHRIQKVIHGIKIHVDLMLLQDEETHNIMDALQDNDDHDRNENPLYSALLNECVDRLCIHLGCITLHIVHIELKSENDENPISINQETPMLGKIEMQKQQGWTTLNDDIVQQQTQINSNGNM